MSHAARVGPTARPDRLAHTTDFIFTLIRRFRSRARHVRSTHVDASSSNMVELTPLTRCARSAVGIAGGAVHVARGAVGVA